MWPQDEHTANISANIPAKKNVRKQQVFKGPIPLLTWFLFKSPIFPELLQLTLVSERSS